MPTPSSSTATPSSASDLDEQPMQTEEDWKDLFEKFAPNGRTFRDFTQLTPESMEVIYMIAYNHYNSGKFADAEKIFRLLSMLDHFERKYWKGLAASQEAQKKFADALRAYGYLGMMDAMDPYPAFQAAKCFVALGRAAEAEAGLRAATFNSANKPEFAQLHLEAKALLDLVQKARRDQSGKSNAAAS